MFEMYNINMSKRNAENEYYDFYTIKKGDTLYQISRNYNINPNLLAAINGLNLNDYIYPDQTIMVPKNNFSYYITKDGDTISSVADTFGSNIEKIIKYNQTIYLQPSQLIVNKIK